MAFQRSAADSIQAALAPAMRELQDMVMEVVGTETQVLRIMRTGIDDFGDFDVQKHSILLSNVIINYPFNKIEIFNNQNAFGNMETNSIDLSEIIPIEMWVRFKGNQTEQSVNLKKGDYIVDVFWDEYGTPMPLVLEAQRFRGWYHGKHLVGKGAELTVVRGNLEPELKKILDGYLNSLEKPPTEVPGQ